MTLTRGDVLFLPAYWFHRVESHVRVSVFVLPHQCLQGLSLSLNIWIDSQPYVLMEDAFNLALPFDESWSPAKLVCGSV